MAPLCQGYKHMQVNKRETSRRDNVFPRRSDAMLLVVCTITSGDRLLRCYRRQTITRGELELLRERSTWYVS